MTRRDIVLYIVLWLTGVIFILLKGYFMKMLSDTLLDLDIIIILIGFIYLKYGPVGAGCFAFGQGFVTDLFSGGLQGLFVTLYMAVFGVILVSALIFNLSDPKGQAIIVTLGIMTKKFLLIIILFLASRTFYLSKSVLSIFLVSVILTGLCAPVVFFVLNKIRTRLLCPNGMPDSGLVLEEGEG